MFGVREEWVRRIELYPRVVEGLTLAIRPGSAVAAT